MMPVCRPNPVQGLIRALFTDADPDTVDMNSPNVVHILSGYGDVEKRLSVKRSI